MPPVDIPHFEVPFRIGANGHARVVDQDSDDDVLQCVRTIVGTEKGSRLDIPAMGLPDLVFREGGPDVSVIISAIDQFEDRAATVIDLSQDQTIDQLAWQIELGVEGAPS